jgi:hypothetical protein
VPLTIEQMINFYFLKNSKIYGRVGEPVYIMALVGYCQVEGLPFIIAFKNR